MFPIELPHDNLICECSNIGTTGREKIGDWLLYCREICFCWTEKSFNGQELLGGEGVEVEIDEFKIGKRKYERKISGRCMGIRFD